MKVIEDNLWNSTDDVILVTCNSYLRKDGAVVMGRGAALELKTKFPSLPYVFGEYINYICGDLGEYRVVFTGTVDNPTPKPIYGLFQVKYHYRDAANLFLVKDSTKYLKWLAENWWADKKVSMNFPAIGFGWLKYEDILPVVEVLPDNVTLYIKI